MSLLSAACMLPLSTSPTGSTDDFNVDSLSSYTQYADSTGTWSVSGGYLSESGGEQSILVRKGVSFADGEVSCVITQAFDAGLVLRLLDNNNFYIATIKDASGNGGGSGMNTVQIYKKILGAWESLGSPASISFPSNTSHAFAFSAVGATLKATFDGVEVRSVTNSALSGPGMCGIRSHVGPAKFDSFTWP